MGIVALVAVGRCLRSQVGIPISGPLAVRPLFPGAVVGTVALAAELFHCFDRNYRTIMTDEGTVLVTARMVAIEATVVLSVIENDLLVRPPAPRNGILCWWT